MRLAFKALFGVTASSFVLVNILAQPSQAADLCGGGGTGLPSCQPQPFDWAQGQGVAAPTHNQYAKSWQNILYIEGAFSSTGSIDGYFGSGTTTATKTWQAQHALTADGQVGYNSWNNARNGSNRVRQADGTYVTVPHMTRINDGQYVYQEYGKTSRTGNYYWSGFHWDADRVGCVNNTTHTSCADS